MTRLRDLLRKALEQPLGWKEIGWTYDMVHQAARLLKNEAGHSAAQVRQAYLELLETMQSQRYKAGPLGAAVDHFKKVSRSYWPGLFHCYEVPDLPRTNNDLEHLFGSHRHHECRATGRRTAGPSAVLRGSVRMVAGVATRLRPYDACDLASVKAEHWQRLRRQLDQRREARVQRTRFRRNPDAYLANLEEQANQLVLPV